MRSGGGEARARRSGKMGATGARAGVRDTTGARAVRSILGFAWRTEPIDNDLANADDTHPNEPAPTEEAGNEPKTCAEAPRRHATSARAGPRGGLTPCIDNIRKLRHHRRRVGSRLVCERDSTFPAAQPLLMTRVGAYQALEGEREIV